MAPLSHRVTQKSNRASYYLVDSMIYAGLGRKQNQFREKTLGFSKLTKGAATNVHRLGIPHLYLMSTSVVPRPDDWPSQIGMTGFAFLDTKTGYQPSEELKNFLEKGEPPIYVGFGSIVVEDPVALGDHIIEGIRISGQRAIISPGWARIGVKQDIHDDAILLVEDIPHDYLFEKCSVVVHHGGAGTTAIGLKYGCPTIIVPFFGDQAFWADHVNNLGLGPKGIPQKELTGKKFAEAIEFCLDPKVKAQAEKISTILKKENGVEKAVEFFHRSLPLRNGMCNHSFFFLFSFHFLNYAILIVQGVWTETIYEIQRKVPLMGWGQSNYTDKTGELDQSIESFYCPPEWEYIEDWQRDQWKYAVSFTFGKKDHWHENDSVLYHVRTRKLTRRRRFTRDLALPLQERQYSGNDRILFIDVKELTLEPGKLPEKVQLVFDVVSREKFTIQTTKIKDKPDAQDPVKYNFKNSFWSKVYSHDEVEIRLLDSDTKVASGRMKCSDVNSGEGVIFLTNNFVQIAKLSVRCNFM